MKQAAGSHTLHAVPGTATSKAAEWPWALPIGLLLGLLFSAIALDGGYVTGTGPKWERPTDDLNAYLVSLLYFLREPWRVPLFAVPGMGYPEGGSVVTNDGIPLGALIAKIVFTLTGHPFNHFGWWMVAAYALQGVFSVRLVLALGLRSRLAAACLAVWGILAFVFISRALHIALCGQFLVLWALSLYFEDVRAGRLSAGEQVALAVVAILVNPYLFAMTLAVQLATVLTVWRRDGLLRADRWKLLGGGVLLLTVMAAGGYGAGGASFWQLSIRGFGHYSWNPISSVVPPPRGLWSGITASVVRDRTGGQYEGDAYLGLAPLVALALTLVVCPRAAWEKMRTHWILCAILAALAMFAASNHVSLSSLRLVDLPLPRRLEIAAGFFRVSGRFIWPLTYLLTVAPAVLLLKARPTAAMLAVIVLLTVAQVAEGLPLLRTVRQWSTAEAPELIPTARLEAWMRRHDRVFEHPSFYCGGLGDYASQEQKDRDYQLQVLAARVGRPNNSIAMSRELKDCAREARWAREPSLEPGVLYIVSKGVTARAPRVAELTRSGRCVDLTWGFVCSREVLE